MIARPFLRSRYGERNLQLSLFHTKRTTPRGFLLSGPLNLATSYSRTTYRCTTIGAAAFHFRVRDGNGWCHRVMITRGRNREIYMFPWTSQDFGSLGTRSLPCRLSGFKRTAAVGSLDPTHRYSLTSADSSKKCLKLFELKSIRRIHCLR